LAEAHNYPHFYYHAWQGILNADDLAVVERQNETREIALDSRRLGPLLAQHRKKMEEDYRIWSQHSRLEYVSWNFCHVSIIYGYCFEAEDLLLSFSGAAPR
jgi:hypothetical protein